MDAAFANGNIGSYDDYMERLKEAYGLHNVKLGYNKAVKVATFLGNKQMVIKEGKNYVLNPEPLLSPTLLYCRGVYIRIKQSRQEVTM